jgi:hypothetical protein
MPGPFSPALRIRVVGAFEEGATRREVGERFGVSVSSAVRRYQVRRNEGWCEAKRRKPFDAGAAVEPQREKCVEDGFANLYGSANATKLSPPDFDPMVVPPVATMATYCLPLLPL